MSDKIKILAVKLVALAFIALAFMGLGGMIGHQRGLSSCPGLVSTADTVTAIDSTVTAGTVARPDADSLIRIDSVPYPVPYPVPLPSDTVHDTVYVYLALEHRLYEIPGKLKVWYSGIMTSIDSTLIYSHSTTITNTVTRTEHKEPLLTAYLGAGAMYNEKRINPYLVGEVRWNSPKTTFGLYGFIDHKGKCCTGLNVTYRIDLIK